MEMNIEEKTENALLDRTEVKGTLTFTGATPSNALVREAVGKQLKIPSDRIVVKGVYTHFGQQNATFEAHAYKSKEQLQKIEPVTKAQKEAVKKEEEKKKAAEEKKAAEDAKKAEEKKEEAAEEKAEKKPEEEKK